MTLRFQETSDKFIVCFTDAKLVDQAQIQSVGDGLLEICERAARASKMLLLDFRGVQFMSSAMVGQLMLFHKEAKKQSLHCRFTNISPSILEVFRITRVHTLFRMDDDDPEFLGSGVPRPKPPSTLDGRANPPSD